MKYRKTVGLYSVEWRNHGFECAVAAYDGTVFDVAYCHVNTTYGCWGEFD